MSIESGGRRRSSFFHVWLLLLLLLLLWWLEGIRARLGRHQVGMGTSSRIVDRRRRHICDARMRSMGADRLGHHAGTHAPHIPSRARP
jgi:hypothetical protein